MNSKLDMVQAQVSEICKVIEEKTGYMYDSTEFSGHKALTALGMSDIGLPSVETIKEMLQYVEDHYPALVLNTVVEYAEMLLVGDLDILDTQLETEAALDVMVEFVTTRTGYSFEEVLAVIQKETA